MRLKLINNTSYEDIRVELDSIEYYLREGDNVFEIATPQLQLKIKLYDKSKVYFWSMILCNLFFFDFMLGDEIGSASLICNSNYYLSSDREECVVVLSKITAEKRGLLYLSVFADTYAQIHAVEHSLNEKEAVKKKFIKRNFQLLLLLVMVLVPLFFLDIGVGIAVSVFSLFFSVPCIKRLVNAKKLFSDKNATDILNKQIIKEIRKR